MSYVLLCVLTDFSVRRLLEGIGGSDFCCHPCADARLWTEEKDVTRLSFILSSFSETH